MYRPRLEMEDVELWYELMVFAQVYAPTKTLDNYAHLQIYIIKPIHAYRTSSWAIAEKPHCRVG